MTVSSSGSANRGELKASGQAMFSTAGTLHNAVRLRQIWRRFMPGSCRFPAVQVATNVLHYFRNVPNSVNTSAGLGMDHVRAASVFGVARVAGLPEEHQDDVARFPDSTFTAGHWHRAEMGGALSVHGGGLGKGAAFALELLVQMKNGKP
jgi:hypothetical protein